MQEEKKIYCNIGEQEYQIYLRDEDKKSVIMLDNKIITEEDFLLLLGDITSNITANDLPITDATKGKFDKQKLDNFIQKIINSPQEKDKNNNNDKKNKEKEENKEENQEIPANKRKVINYINNGNNIQNLNFQDVIAYLSDDTTYKNMGTGFTRSFGFNRKKKQRYYALCTFLYDNFLPKQMKNKTCKEIFDEKTAVETEYLKVIREEYDRKTRNINNDERKLQGLQNALNQVGCGC